MDILTLLNPAESIQDTIEDVDSQVLAQYMPETEEDSDEELELNQGCLQRKQLQQSKSSVYTKKSRWKEILRLFVRWRGMNMLYGAASWNCRISVTLEAMFHVSRHV